MENIICMAMDHSNCAVFHRFLFNNYMRRTK